MMNLSCLIFAAAALGLLAAAPAQAFQLQNPDGSVTDARTNPLDLDTKAAPDKPASKSDENGAIKQGPFYLHFNNGNSFNQRYNADNLFNPDYRDGR